MQRDRHLASGDLCRERAPLGQGSRASQLADLLRDEMAFLIELVVHPYFESVASPVRVAETVDANSQFYC